MYCSAFHAIGQSGITTMTNARVSAESARVSAISLGVFWRTAPSTSAIIRSRKDSPVAAVMRTTMRSERTRVPPVTPERSPPASRITGADSPVIAASSTRDALDNLAVARDHLARLNYYPIVRPQFARRNLFDTVLSAQSIS